MLARILRVFLLSLVHVIITLYEKFTEFIKRKKACLNPEKPVHNLAQYISQFVRGLERKPSHMVVQVDSDSFDVKDLALLVLWSLLAGIPYISFYDTDGSLKKIEDELIEAVDKKPCMPGLIKWNLKSGVNRISNGQDCCSNGIRNGQNGYNNGHNRCSKCKTPTINISVINRHYSTQGIVQLAQDLVKKQVYCRHEEEFYTVGEIDNLLIKHHYYPNIPEPDIMIYMGPVCMTKGLLPWHVRLTEFVPIWKYKTVHIDEYLAVLSRFSKCAVNLGK